MDTQAKDIDGPSGDARGLEETQGAQGYYALEQLSDLAKSINLFTDALAAYRAQVEQLLSSGKNEAAYEIFRVMEQERKSLVACLLETRPYLLELEHPLAGPAEVLSKQLASFQLMTKDYSKLTGVLKQFAARLPSNTTTNAAIIGRLMNNVRMGHYPTDPAHVDLLAQAIEFPSNATVNVLDPCCGTGTALRRLTEGRDCVRYGMELDESRAEKAQSLLDRVGFGSFFRSNISFSSFHAVFLNPPYLSVLTEGGGHSRDEKRFLLESIPLLTRDGFMAYIVPYYRMTEDICQIICDNFAQVRVYRFMDSEFQKFKQVAVLGTRKKRSHSDGEDASQLCNAAYHPERLPTLDTLSPNSYVLPAKALKVETFRGAVFNVDELARQLKGSSGFDRLFAKSRLDSEPKQPPLPLSISQVGLIGGSGLLNGLMECEYPHIIKGRIIKERHTRSEENRSYQGELISTTHYETISNRMVFNILTPNGFRSLA